jgi:hypothetical protein
MYKPKHFSFPEAMSFENLRAQDVEPLGFETLKGIFNAYRYNFVERASLVEAIHSWQVTEAWTSAGVKL